MNQLGESQENIYEVHYIIQYNNMWGVIYDPYCPKYYENRLPRKKNVCDVNSHEGERIYELEA